MPQRGVKTMNRELTAKYRLTKAIIAWRATGRHGMRFVDDTLSKATADEEPGTLCSTGNDYVEVR